MSLLQQYVYQNFHVSAVTPFLSYVIKLKNYMTLFFSFIFFQRSHQQDYIYSHNNIRENKLISYVGTRLYNPVEDL